MMYAALLASIVGRIQRRGSGEFGGMDSSNSGVDSSSHVSFTAQSLLLSASWFAHVAQRQRQTPAETAEWLCDAATLPAIGAGALGQPKPREGCVCSSPHHRHAAYAHRINGNSSGHSMQRNCRLDTPLASCSRHRSLHSRVTSPNTESGFTARERVVGHQNRRNVQERPFCLCTRAPILSATLAVSTTIALDRAKGPG